MRFSTIFLFLSTDVVRNCASGKSWFAPAISNGDEAVPHQFPWVARMVINKTTTEPGNFFKLLSAIMTKQLFELKY